MCATTSSRLDDFFRYSYLYTVMITIFLGVKLLPLKYPRSIERCQGFTKLQDRNIYHEYGTLLLYTCTSFCKSIKLSDFVFRAASNRVLLFFSSTTSLSKLSRSLLKLMKNAYHSFICMQQAMKGQ